MAPLDWFLAVILGGSLLLGAWRGLVQEVLSVLGWIAAFVAAQWLAPQASQWLPMAQSSPALRYAAGFVVVFIAVIILASVLTWLVKKVVEAVGLRPIDRVLGAGFGLVRGVIIVLAITVVALMTPLKTTEAWNQSVGAQMAAQGLKKLKPMLPERFAQHLPG